MPASRVLQHPVSKRSTILMVSAVLALFVLCTASRASAESAVYSHPRVNVFLNCSVDSEPGEPYRTICFRSIYRHGGFEYTKSTKYASLFYNEKETVVGIMLELVPPEEIVQIETEYIYGHRLIHLKWNGKGDLPLQRRYKGTEVFLTSVSVGVHSPKLPNQPKEPEYEGMH